MSVVTLPRRGDSPFPHPLAPSPVRRRPRTATHRADAPRRNAVRSKWRTASPVRKSTIVLVLAVVASLGGSMVVANRQVQIHQLQSQLLQVQSSYAEQVGTLTSRAAPSRIAAAAGALNLVDPVVVLEVPSTSLDAPLPLPRFSGYAPVTSRTTR